MTTETSTLPRESFSMAGSRSAAGVALDVVVRHSPDLSSGCKQRASGRERFSAGDVPPG